MPAHVAVATRGSELQNLLAPYRPALVDADATTRAAAALTGISRATAARHARVVRPFDPAPRPDQVNKLSSAERARVLRVLDSAEFVDQPPCRSRATLLERGQYLCSVSTMYRILAAVGQDEERRRLVRHPARAVPELAATRPGQVYTWDLTKLAGRRPRGLLRRLRDDRHLLPTYRRRPRSRPRIGAAGGGDEGIFGIHGIPAVVHADRGTSRTSKPSRPCSPTWRRQVTLPAPGLQRQPVPNRLVRPGRRTSARLSVYCGSSHLRWG